MISKNNNIVTRILGRYLKFDENGYLVKCRNRVLYIRETRLGETTKGKSSRGVPWLSTAPSELQVEDYDCERGSESLIDGQCLGRVF